MSSVIKDTQTMLRQHLEEVIVIMIMTDIKDKIGEVGYRYINDHKLKSDIGDVVCTLLKTLFRTVEIIDNNNESRDKIGLLLYQKICCSDIFGFLDGFCPLGIDFLTNLKSKIFHAAIRHIAVPEVCAKLLIQLKRRDRMLEHNLLRIVTGKHL